MAALAPDAGCCSLQEDLKQYVPGKQSGWSSWFLRFILLLYVMSVLPACMYVYHIHSGAC